MSKYTNFTASQQIRAGGGKIHGIVVNSHSSGTLKLWDSLSAAGTVICNTITFASGPNFINFGSTELGGIDFYTGLYATLGGTADITILWMPN